MAIRRDATTWLREYLSTGLRSSVDVKCAAKAAGVEVEVLLRAKGDLAVEAVRQGTGPEGGWFWQLPDGSKDGWGDKKAALELLNAIRDREVIESWSLDRIVEWVSEHRLDRVVTMSAADVPNGRALDMLLWAKEKPDDFRQMYDAKLMALCDGVKRVKGGRKVGIADGAGQDAIDRLLKRSGGNGAGS